MGRRTVLFDAGRLVQRGARATPTGVDRVCLAYAEWLMGRDDLDCLPVRARDDGLLALDRRWFSEQVRSLRERWTGNGVAAPEARLIEALGRGRVPRSLASPEGRQSGARSQAVARLLMTRPLPSLKRGSLYVNVGHTGLTGPRLLARLAAGGVNSLLMVHDLIPITHPEYCRPGEAARHRTRIRVALRQASTLVVNSRTTGDVLADFAATEGLVSPPVVVAPLGLEPPFLTRGHSPALRPYMVHVGTIEARKNLAFILTLWRRLEETLGEATPGLVLIGRQGWENEAVLDHLERSPPLQGLVHQASELPDTALSRLMRGARAVIAPSFVEGFDLPAVEAMAMGVPLIASDIAAHREFVSAATLIDPLDGPGWIAALIQAAQGRGDAPGFVPPDWPGHFRRLDTAMTGLGISGRRG